MATDPIFDNYFKRRQDLIESLSPVDEAIRDWWAKYRVLEPTAGDVEALESMVAARTTIMQGQLRLDEGMVAALARRRDGSVS